MATVFIDKLMDSSFATFFVPFLLVFAIVFGILSKINLFKKADGGEAEEKRAKRINLGISLVVGLIFASVSLATDCLSAILPKFAIVLIVLLVVYMIMGFVINVQDNKSLFNIALGILVAIGFVIILFMSSEACGLKIGPLDWIIGSWWKWVAGVIIIGGLLAWMINGGKKSEGKSESKREPKRESKSEEPESPKEEKQEESQEE